MNTTRISFILSFQNPTFLSPTQPTIGFVISRKINGSTSSNIYGQTSSGVNLCTVSQLLLNASSSLLTLSNF